MRETKELLLVECKSLITAKREDLSRNLEDLRRALETETKSSARDKHETGRAMLQLEIEKLGEQLAKVEQSMELLDRISLELSPNIRLGSVVITDRAKYFISLSLGEISLENSKFYAISPLTPIGKLLMGQKTGGEFNFRDQKSTILQVY